MQRLRALRSASWILCGLAPPLFAGIAVLLGKEAGWDFLNYHWYNPFALLNKPMGFDIAVAHHATYYNPLLDVPLYWVAQHGPAWLGGALLGASYGVAVALVGAIAYKSFPIAQPGWRLASATALALLGVAGGGAFPAIGNTSNDVPVAIGVFAALLIVINHCPQLQQEKWNNHLLASMLMAGMLAGMSMGLKLTTAIYLPGLVLAICVGATYWRMRVWCVTSFGLGVALGVALFAGYWMLRMWEFGGNPLFPYFNQLFHSPLLVQESYRDPSHLPKGALAFWLFPYYFTVDSHRVAEWTFRDAHVLAVYVIVPATLLLMLCGRIKTNEVVTPRVALCLFVFAGAAYLAWLFLFGIYRYLIPLEMLCPVLIASAVLLWPLQRRAQFALLTVLFVALQMVVKVSWDRQPWRQTYVSVAAPSLSDPSHSMVLMAGTAPMAFVIPSFPVAVRFIRIDGWLVHRNDATSGLARALHDLVKSQEGPIYMLFASEERDSAIEAARAYRLEFINQPCQWVRATIAAPLELCRLARTTPNA